jgi:hypothetical protein
MIELAEFKITVGLSEDRSWTNRQIDLMIEYLIINGLDEVIIKERLDGWIMDDDVIIEVEQTA